MELSDEELAALRRLSAEAGGISLQSVLVAAALDPGAGSSAERREALVELFAARRALSGIAVNANQLARRANVGDGFPVLEAREFLVAARVLVSRIDGAIDGLAAEGVSG